MSIVNIQQEYTKDFYAWILHNLALVRAGKLAEMDIEHLAEELESMGRKEKEELMNRLVILMTHLLKYKFQPVRCTRSWVLTIKEQRKRIIKRLKDSPSLKPELASDFNEAYEYAVLSASKQTNLDEDKFPTTCPFSLGQCLDLEFFPDE